MLSMLGTDSVFNSKESGVISGNTEQKEVDPLAILEVGTMRPPSGRLGKFIVFSKKSLIALFSIALAGDK